VRAKINSYIVSDDDAGLYRWFGINNVTCPADIRQAVMDNPDGEDLVLEINSYGGSMFSGFEIYNVLKGANCRTVAEIQSLAASAASTAACGCDEVRASPVAQFMMHDPAMGTSGNATEHNRSLQALDSFKASILNAYQLKCNGKKTRQELDTMMSDETWLSVQQAIDAGLVDTLLYDDNGIIAENVMNAVGNGFRAMSGGLPDIEHIRAAYQAAQGQPTGSPSGDTPADPDPNNTADRDRLAAELELLSAL